MRIQYFEEWSLNEALEPTQDSEFQEFHNIMQQFSPKAQPAVSTYVDAFKTLQKYPKSEKEEIVEILKTNIFIEPLNLIINPDSSKKDINIASERPTGTYTKGNIPGLYDIPENTAKYVVRWFLHAGMSLDGACALAGNLWKESYFNPYQKEISGGPGRGLAQWTNTVRWTDYTSLFYPDFRVANQFTKNYDMYSLEAQLSFCVYELKTGYRGVWNTLVSSGDLSGKTMKVLKKYEIPATKDDPGEQMKRKKCAEIILGFAQRDPRIKFISNSVLIQKKTKPELFT